MRITRRTLARLLSAKGNTTVDLPSGDIQDLEIPDGTWTVLVFSFLSMRDDSGFRGRIGNESDPCELRRYIFGERLEKPDGENPYAVTSAGHKELQPGDIFVPVHAVPAPV